jgi:hypothetical protein
MPRMQQRQLESEKTASLAEAEDALNPCSPLTGEEAATLLPPCHSKAVEDLRAALSREARKFRRGVLCGIGGLGIFGALMVAAMSVVDEEASMALIPAQLIFSGTLTLLFLSLFVVNFTRKSRQQRQALTVQVVDQHQVRAIGPLIDAWHLGDMKTREISMAALSELLPLMKAEDAALLTPSQRVRLCHQLGFQVENPLHKDIRVLFQPADDRKIDFHVAILQAFGQVGDSNAIPVVTPLAAREPRTQGEKRIHEAATACLAALLLRREQARSSETLLRSSQPSAADPNTLLRPAEGSGETAPAELLRPGAHNS